MLHELKRTGKEQPCHISRYYPSIHLDILCNIMGNSVPAKM